MCGWCWCTILQHAVTFHAYIALNALKATFKWQMKNAANLACAFVWLVLWMCVVRWKRWKHATQGNTKSGWQSLCAVYFSSNTYTSTKQTVPCIRWAHSHRHSKFHTSYRQCMRRILNYWPHGTHFTIHIFMWVWHFTGNREKCRPYLLVLADTVCVN